MESKELLINRDTEIGKAQMEAINHFGKVVNEALKAIFKEYTYVKNVRVSIKPPEEMGQFTCNIQLETHDKYEELEKDIDGYKRRMSLKFRGKY